MKTFCPHCTLVNDYNKNCKVVSCVCGQTYTAENYLIKEENTLDKVANQPHYTQFEIQPMEYCQRNKLGWCASNVVKYVSRENKKNGLEDLYKAMDYLRCAIYHKETGIFLTPDKLSPIKIEALK